MERKERMDKVVALLSEGPTYARTLAEKLDMPKGHVEQALKDAKVAGLAHRLRSRLNPGDNSFGWGLVSVPQVAPPPESLMKNLRTRYKVESTVKRMVAHGGSTSYAAIFEALPGISRRDIYAYLAGRIKRGQLRRVRMDEQVFLVAPEWVEPDESIVRRIAGSCKEHGGCLVWVGEVKARGERRPELRLSVNRKPTDVRRWLYEHFNGPLPARISLEPMCGCDECIDPDHMHAYDFHRAKGRRVSAQGMLNMLTARRERSTLTWDMVRAIRASSETQAALAERYGITRQNVSSIMRHETWREDRGPLEMKPVDPITRMVHMAL